MRIFAVIRNRSTMMSNMVEFNDCNGSHAEPGKLKVACRKRKVCRLQNSANSQRIFQVNQGRSKSRE
jgi:hypothetical protein